MSQEWISGRFRGVYASERSQANEGARRLPIQLEYGELLDARPSAGPPSGEAADELRFARLARVKVASDEGGPERERTLFDVRIRDWQLLYPAESARRIYGTLVGELSGRLAPVPVEPEPARVRLPEPVRAAPAPALAAPPEARPEPPPGPPTASAPAPLQGAPLPVAQPDEATAEQDVERLLWLVVPLLLCVIGGAFALVCTPQTAGIWLTPLAAAIAIRQTPSRYRIQGTLARRWFGGLCMLAQVFVLLALLQTERTAGCRPPLAAELPFLAAPLVAASFVRTQSFVWVCALIWTTALAAWCGGLGGTCSTAALAAPARSAAPPLLAPLRTDPGGRWPAAPKLPGSVPSADAPSDAAPLAGSPQAAPPEPPGPKRAAQPEPSADTSGAAPRFARISLDQATRDPDAFFKPDGPRIYMPADDLFEPGAAELRRGREANLEQLVRLLALRPEQRVVVEVHTDASGDASAQRSLARQRAAALAEWFGRRDELASGQLAFEPLGAARPLVPSDGSSSEQRANRRLEVRLKE